QQAFVALQFVGRDDQVDRQGLALTHVRQREGRTLQSGLHALAEERLQVRIRCCQYSAARDVGHLQERRNLLLGVLVQYLANGVEYHRKVVHHIVARQRSTHFVEVALRGFLGRSNVGDDTRKQTAAVEIPEWLPAVEIAGCNQSGEHLSIRDNVGARQRE